VKPRCTDVKPPIEDLLATILFHDQIKSCARTGGWLKR